VSLPSTQNLQGGIDVDMAGAPIQVRSEQVCISLSVPKGVAMRAQGWPLVVYAHDTERSYRSFVKDGIAQASLHRRRRDRRATGTSPSSGIDQVQHGTRRARGTPRAFSSCPTSRPSPARGNRLPRRDRQISITRFARGPRSLGESISDEGEIKSTAFSSGVTAKRGEGASRFLTSTFPTTLLSGASGEHARTMLVVQSDGAGIVVAVRSCRTRSTKTIRVRRSSNGGSSRPILSFTRRP